jgi:hypothetical protein
MKNISVTTILITICLVVNAFGQRKSVSAAEVNGTFKMNYTGKAKDFSNQIDILAVGGGKIKISFALVYPKLDSSGEIAENYGTAEGIAAITGDTAIYTSDEFGPCKITIKFVKLGSIKVTQGGLPSDCGFGGDVFATGIYKKVSSKKPSMKN